MCIGLRLSESLRRAKKEAGGCTAFPQYMEEERCVDGHRWNPIGGTKDPSACSSQPHRVFAEASEQDVVWRLDLQED